MKLAEFIEDHHDQHLAELCAFLRIPSVSAKSEHKPDIERAARLVSLGPISGMRRSSVLGAHSMARAWIWVPLTLTSMP
jgi:acetylornithine deacetylase/succinyl-diaminopimelate desuccinylase-like protein